MTNHIPVRASLLVLKHFEHTNSNAINWRYYFIPSLTSHANESTEGRATSGDQEQEDTQRAGPSPLVRAAVNSERDTIFVVVLKRFYKQDEGKYSLKPGQ